MPKTVQSTADPMPPRIEPALALLDTKAPEGDRWVYEIKWDGYRLAVHVEPDRVRVLTRGGHDWTDRFPIIASAAQALNRTMILDGEAVVLDQGGRSNFGLLQQALGGRGGKRRSHEAILYVFDLLYLDGYDLTRLPFSERRALLDPIFSGTGAIRLSEYIRAEGDEMLAVACARGLEGIIAKDVTSRYRPGRRGDWLKIKCVSSDSFAIVGYEPSDVGFGGIGRLLLAARKGDKLVYVGGVGSGLTEGTGKALRAQLEALRTDEPEVKLNRKGAVFVRPDLIAEIEYREWTREGKLKHAAYKGLRERQDEASTFQIDEA